ncbi:uncharacterized protein L969DRAFT_95999 [Mixia osmundae IAM 14324]|uniref:Glucose-methanol-choline oxidoreductase N-terminal domain-containing protein n=1 Tax=Mixia osmundae (strain CBS 9802 / IAM 14324 / JCM 22182 / KY 12970) TaxID=764103 RepID=G7DWS7_MIXOS|nr:uncharacterized protein L969DRAFT_97544 [Mixia osmundae IAM 14324]XP_014566728.1 uncharacterized protein L969DRAFT_95999 [Mixia osmundae IAM 14324]KEI36198.1 hypothetical protein L969DRAFT_97544 [Mixia osmundae IAM 14324]KEI38166.1 hypothetical protein L969DRAFT_95999 [Mixia osmundae IAM 14324]GAA95024.1 hypothetical protein E5Q_01679 [Mixia osmundae IAM 14324]
MSSEMSEAAKQCDVLFIGGGTASLVAATRLAHLRPDLSILIIEKGEDQTLNPAVSTPGLFLSHLVPNSATVDYHIATPSPHLGARRPVVVPTGHALGGSSQMHWLQYTKPLASDFDAMGSEGFDCHSMMPLVDRSLGAVKASVGETASSDLVTQFVQACENQGIPFDADRQLGHSVQFWPRFVADGKRQDPASCMLTPARATCTNIEVLMGHRVDRILFDADKEATGVVIYREPIRCTAGPSATAVRMERTMLTCHARKLVILGAGALASPAILERSGLGRPNILKALGIPVLAAVPGIGATYRDHPNLKTVYRAGNDTNTLDALFCAESDAVTTARLSFKSGTGPLSTNYIDVGCKLRPCKDTLMNMSQGFKQYWRERFAYWVDRPLLQLVFVPGLQAARTGDLASGKYLTAGLVMLHPQSSGSIHIRSTDPAVPAVFDAGYLSCEQDMEVAIWAYKKSREIMRRLPAYRGEAAAFHPRFPDHSTARCMSLDVDGPAQKAEGMLEYSSEDDDIIAEWVRATISTTAHPMGTLPMRPLGEGGVVDTRMNVHGVARLKVIDLSILPDTVSGNPAAVALALGEKAALLIAEETDSM